MILDGKKIKEEILEKLKEKIEKEKISATLAIILASKNEASKIYIQNKRKACEKIGINFEVYTYEETVTEKNIIANINELNSDKKITGIILQSPIYPHLDFDRCASEISPHKDVDGFTKENIYNLYMNKECLMPCTVKGIIRLLEAYKIPVEGQDILIVGRGNIVGHPLSLALTNKNATVTLSHSKTKDLNEKCLKADIIISATGRSNLITEDMVKKETVVIDVGVTRENGKICGDVDYEKVKDKVRYITPNPGGVGPMTVAMIMENIIEAYERGRENG